MKLIIDIPDEFYKRAMSENGMCYTDAEVVVNAFYDGTPLPKGHGDLIDRKELLDWSYGIVSMHCELDKVVNVDVIKDAPTIIEADKEVEDKDDG